MNLNFQTLFLLFILIFTFCEVQAQEKIKSDTTYIAQFADVGPEFPGGQDAFMRFIFDNLVYPEKAKSDKTEGRVILSFVIDVNGKPGNAIILQNLSPETDKEALRIISLLPNFTPGYYKGEIVPVRINLPVQFKLSQASGKQKRKSKTKP